LRGIDEDVWVLGNFVPIESLANVFSRLQIVKMFGVFAECMPVDRILCGFGAEKMVGFQVDVGIVDFFQVVSSAYEARYVPFINKLFVGLPVNGGFFARFVIWVSNNIFIGSVDGYKRDGFQRLVRI
jgi:hypothetical protein